MFAPGMMYLGRAGPSKTIELTSLSLSLVSAEDERGVDFGGTNTSGRIGPSKMSAHSLIFSVSGDLGDRVAGFLIRGGDEGGGGGGGMAMDEVRGMTWACLEIEDEWVRRAMMEEVRRCIGANGSWR